MYVILSVQSKHNSGPGVLKPQEITGRISADRQFRKYRQVGTALFCQLNALNDLFSVELKISNVTILLNESDLH